MDYEVGVLTVSDRSYRGEREDGTGPVLVEMLEAAGFRVTTRGIVPDEMIQIEETLVEWADQ